MGIKEALLLHRFGLPLRRLNKGIIMPPRPSTSQIAFRFRAIDSPAGVTRATVTRLANLLDVNETQVIHLALRDMAFRMLPHYEADGGSLTTTQIHQIKQLVPQIKKQSVRSSLIQLSGGSFLP